MHENRDSGRDDNSLGSFTALARLVEHLLYPSAATFLKSMDSPWPGVVVQCCRATVRTPLKRVVNIVANKKYLSKERLACNVFGLVRVIAGDERGHTRRNPSSRGIDKHIWSMLHYYCFFHTVSPTHCQACIRPDLPVHVHTRRSNPLILYLTYFDVYSRCSLTVFFACKYLEALYGVSW